MTPSHIVVTVEQWNQLLSILGWLTLFGGFSGAFFAVDWWRAWDRFRARRRLARCRRVRRLRHA